MFEWVNGKLTGETADKTLQLNSEAIGRAAAFGEVMNLSYEEIYPEVSNEAEAHIPYAEE